MSALSPQTTLQNGAFQIESVIGRGGFGITYRARDVEKQCGVAIKECFPAGCGRQGNRVVATDFWSHQNSEALQNRFRTQVRQLERISHPNLARVSGCFEENGTVYLVMELVEGRNLLQVLEAEEVSLQQAQKWIEKIASALGALHQNGLLHLDVKPENIILRANPRDESKAISTKNEENSAGSEADSTKNEAMENGEPVLLDFDLVQPQHDDLITRPLSLAMQCGTPGYAPLEQYAQSVKMTPATDFYALGATFYHLVTRQVPLGAIDRAAGTFLTPPQQLRAEISLLQSAAILCALAPKSEDRPQSAAEFLELLQPDEPDESAQQYDTPAPLAAQFLKHGTGVYRVVLTSKTPVFPPRCVCCHAKSETSWLLVSPSGRYEVPLCETCKKHQLMSRAASFVTFWGSILSLTLALIVALISVVTSTLFLLFISALCIVMNFAALSYGALKSSRAEEMLKANCCDLSEPATYLFNGRVHVWKFKNSAFAADFKKRNAACVV
ncbi:Serine/threonine protein kinase [Abditibacterium utsteinense]|uniref:Serine/threonine protein kinase n=1 Tax=Abditibacterium utsteinense TaxID=1960156 RepID=A0A2S8STH0_9BACT|nr:serine/threonine-protein kinase [Abditibacterium utsteinense]PQV64103.1 Serine/threonine protein kinase [Abditibacterium utsteinense]